MSKEFVRLYKNIDGQTSRSKCGNGLPERLKVLNALGYETGYKDSIVEANKWHGKAARRRREQVAKPHPPIIQMTTTHSERTTRPRPHNYPRPLAKELSPVSTRGWRTPVLPASSSGSSSISTSAGLSAVKYAPDKGFARERLADDRKYSVNKWDRSEREKLVEIYTSMREPDDPGLRTDFYEAVARRFVVFFPRRPVPEVVARIRSMRRARQMKLQGEAEYWGALGKLSSSQTAAHN